MEIYRLAYMSYAQIEEDGSNLMELVLQSRKNNQRNNITSLLIHGQAMFIQVLEGEKQQLEAVFDKIKQDPRHSHVSVIFTETIPKRRFQHWFLKYLPLNQTRLDRAAGFSEFIQQYQRDRIILPGSPVIVALQDLTEDIHQ